MPGDRISLNVNGIDLSIVDRGTGSPALVFLHFWGGSSRTFGPVIDILSENARCVALDFRGWGQSSRTSTDYQLETLATDVVGVVDSLDLTDFAIVGHSMGGKVAQLVAAHQPVGLKQLILIAPAPPTPLEVPVEQRQEMLESYRTPEGAEKAIGVLTSRPISASHRKWVVDDILSGAPAAKQAWTERGMIQDISDQAAQITVPVMVIVGTSDNVEQETSLRLSFGKVIPHACFNVLQRVGHLSPLEATAELANAIRSAQSS